MLQQATNHGILFEWIIESTEAGHYEMVEDVKN